MISDQALEATRQHCAHLMHDTVGGEISAEQTEEGLITFQYWDEDSDPDEDGVTETLVLKPCGLAPQGDQLYEYTDEDGLVLVIATLHYKTIVALITS